LNVVARFPTLRAYGVPFAEPIRLVAGRTRRAGRSVLSTTDAERWAEPVYLDASALNRALSGLTDVIVSDLALTEMASALSRRTREQRLTREQAHRLYREASKLYASSRRAELTPPIHRRAERLMLSLTIPLRTLDALHLATALDAEAATVITFDPRLRDAATSQGLFVAGPSA
jgi:predicted nucleic acid-binding protein